MDCAETTKKDEEEEDNKNKEDETKASVTVSETGNTLRDISSDEHADKPLAVPTHDGDGIETQAIKQEGSQKVMQVNTNYRTVTLSKKIESSEEATDSADGKSARKDSSEKQTEETIDVIEKPLISTSDTSTNAMTQLIKPEVLKAEQNVLLAEQLKCEDDKPVLVPREEIKTPETKQHHDLKKDIRETSTDPTHSESSIEIDKTSPESISDTVQISSQVQDIYAPDSKQEVSVENIKPENGEATESNEKVNLRPEQPQVPKQTENDVKTKQARAGSGAIAKRRASESPAFKYAQLGQSMQKSAAATSKARDLKTRAQLSPGKTVSTSTGIKGSRSAEELQRGEIPHQVGARRMSRDSTPEARRYSVNKDSLLKLTASPRRKSETPTRSKSSDKTKKGETPYIAKSISSSNKKHAQNQDLKEKDTNNEASDEVVIIQEPQKEAIATNTITEENSQGKEENKISGKEENKLTGKEGSYSDIKEIKTQQNMKVVSADMASVNKISANEIIITGAKVSRAQLPEDQQGGEGKQGQRISAEKCSEKQVALDEVVKQEEESFAQKQIEELLLNQQNVSCKEVSREKAFSKDENVKVLTESSILETQLPSKEPNAKDLPPKDTKNREESVNPLKTTVEEPNEERCSNKIEITRYTTEDIPTASKVEEKNDNNIPNPSIQTHKTLKFIASKIPGVAQEIKEETVDSNLTRERPSKLIPQDARGNKREVSSRGSSIQDIDPDVPLPESCNTALTRNGVSKHKTSLPVTENVDKSARDTSGRVERIEETYKRDQPAQSHKGKENNGDPIFKATKVNGSSSTQVQTSSCNVSGEGPNLDMHEKPVLHSHEELDQFISNQIQAELISNWVMNGEGSSPSSPHDLSPQAISDPASNMFTDGIREEDNKMHKTFEGQAIEPKMVHDQLQRNRPEPEGLSRTTKENVKASESANVESGVTKVPDAKSVKNKVVAGVHSLAARGHSRLAPIQDEEESKEYIMDPQAKVQLSGLQDDVGQGCGGMKSTSCRLYFGVKNYLNQFYDPNSMEHTQGQGYYYTEDDDFEYLVDSDKEQRRQRCCRGFWFRAGVWGGVNLLLVGIIALLVGYLTPPRDMIVGYQDNLEILDRWAIAFNHRLELCRLAGLAVFCCGGVVLLVTLVLSSFVHSNHRCRDETATIVDPFVVSDPGLPTTTGKIPITEQIKSVQPTPWPDLSRGKDAELAVQIP